MEEDERAVAEHPENAGLLGYLTRRGGARPFLERAGATTVDPYYGAGSHPDVVARVWEDLGGALPEDCRCLVLHRPVLVRPDSGLILAIALGTTYALRVPSEHRAEALEKGAEEVHRYGSGGEILDVSREFGPDWIFGFWHQAEPSWCRAAYGTAG
jgi:hypothetical protein